jgi:hypothetical protein
LAEDRITLSGKRQAVKCPIRAATQSLSTHRFSNAQTSGNPTSVFNSSIEYTGTVERAVLLRVAVRLLRRRPGDGQAGGGVDDDRVAVALEVLRRSKSMGSISIGVDFPPANQVRTWPARLARQHQQTAALPYCAP